VQRAEAQVDFPNRIVFSLDAQSDMDIQTVELEYGLASKSCTTDVNSVVPDNFSPGKQVSTEWVWDMKQVRPLPPSPNLIWWRWHLIDASGNEIRTDKQWITWLDSTYDWQTLQSGNIFLHWYSGTEDYIRQFLTVAEDTRTRVQTDFGAWTNQDIQIYIYDSQQTMLANGLIGTDWAGAVTFSGFPNIIIGIPKGSEEWARRTIAHELTHLSVDNMLGFECYADLPIWFNEGLAMYYEGEPMPQDLSLLQTAIHRNSLLPIQSMYAYPDKAGDVSLFYAQAESLVTFLVNQFGISKVPEYLGYLRDGYGHVWTLNTVYGLDDVGLESAWRQFIGAPPARPVEESPTPTAIQTISLSSETQVLSTVSPSPTPQPTPTPTPNGSGISGGSSMYLIVVCVCLLGLLVFLGAGLLAATRRRKAAKALRR
jgi:hypothetical protein